MVATRGLSVNVIIIHKFILISCIDKEEAYTQHLTATTATTIAKTRRREVTVEKHDTKKQENKNYYSFVE